MNINDINTDFDENTEPKDEYLLELLRKAYQGEIKCRTALIPLAEISPFSNYMPEIDSKYTDYFMSKLKDLSPPPLYVYEKDNKIIMSDDYQAYYTYKKYNISPAVCVVIGEAKNANITYKSEPFLLKPPSIDVIN